MLRWDPSPVWQGEDAYIIGGGESLRGFDWDLIRGRNTVGCNAAYCLGVDICQMIVFADLMWWKKVGMEGTEDYGGIVVSACPKLVTKTSLHLDRPWLLSMERANKRGLSRTQLGFPGNTGGLAINLALILGARRVFLLGFDMKLGRDQKANWHHLRYESSKEAPYRRFTREFRSFKETLPKVFPGCEIINVTNDSNLEWFPKVTLEEHFKMVTKGAA